MFYYADLSFSLALGCRSYTQYWLWCGAHTLVFCFEKWAETCVNNERWHRWKWTQTQVGKKKQSVTLWKQKIVTIHCIYDRMFEITRQSGQTLEYTVDTAIQIGQMDRRAVLYEDWHTQYCMVDRDDNASAVHYTCQQWNEAARARGRAAPCPQQAPTHLPIKPDTPCHLFVKLNPVRTATSLTVRDVVMTAHVICLLFMSSHALITYLPAHCILTLLSTLLYHHDYMQVDGCHGFSL